MSEQPTTRPRRGWLIYLAVALFSAAITAGAAAMLISIRQRKDEGDAPYLKLAELNEDTVDPAVWGRIFPRQYDSYRRTVDVERTKYGGSEAESHLAKDERLKRIFAGYAFSIEYREERGHAYMLSDQDETERVRLVKQPGACLHCHSSIIPAYRKAGEGKAIDKALLAKGWSADEQRILAGFEKICATPLKQARELVEHPVTCLDCHDPRTIQLRVTRPGFLEGIDALAKDQGAGPRLEKEKEQEAAQRQAHHALPHLPSIERFRKAYWRADAEAREKMRYNPNTEATRQEMRSFVCGQCHVEYYFKGEGKRVTYPWANGLKAEAIEEYYDKEDFADWTHKETGARVIKAQHPEFEMWSQGIHARSGVSCADCHVPYVREGAMKVSDHQVRSPLLNVARACQTCHRYPEEEIKARAEIIQDRNKKLLDRAEDALIGLIDAFALAKKAGVAESRLDAARKLQRKAQWRVDFVNAENSMGFHAAQEAARLLGEAIDYARQGQLELLKR